MVVLKTKLSEDDLRPLMEDEFLPLSGDQGLATTATPGKCEVVTTNVQVVSSLTNGIDFVRGAACSAVALDYTMLFSCVLFF